MRRQKDQAKGDGSARATAQEAVPATPVSHTAIALRAYELFEARGCADGQDLDDWLTAERELSAATEAGTNEAVRGAAPSRQRERQA